MPELRSLTHHESWPDPLEAAPPVVDVNTSSVGQVIENKRIMDLPLWEGDRHFLPLVFDDAVPQFHGVMPYRDGRPVSWTYSIL